MRHESWTVDSRWPHARYIRMIRTYVASFLLHAGSSAALLLALTALPTATEAMVAILGCCTGALICINTLTWMRVRTWGARPPLDPPLVVGQCRPLLSALVSALVVLLQGGCLLLLSAGQRPYGGLHDLVLISGMGAASAVLTAGV